MCCCVFVDYCLFCFHNFCRISFGSWLLCPSCYSYVYAAHNTCLFTYFICCSICCHMPFVCLSPSRLGSKSFVQTILHSACINGVFSSSVVCHNYYTSYVSFCKGFHWCFWCAHWRVYYCHLFYGLVTVPYVSIVFFCMYQIIIF